MPGIKIATRVGSSLIKGCLVEVDLRTRVIHCLSKHQSVSDSYIQAYHCKEGEKELGPRVTLNLLLNQL